jgi:phosphoglucosamine mutase
VFSEHATTGDGVVAALQVLAVLVREGRPLSELARVMTRVPQILHNINLKNRVAVESMTTMVKVQREVEAVLGDQGRVLIRWSGTENKLRIMLEGPDQAQLDQMARELGQAATQDCS